MLSFFITIQKGTTKTTKTRLDDVIFFANPHIRNTFYIFYVLAALFI